MSAATTLELLPSFHVTQMPEGSSRDDATILRERSPGDASVKRNSPIPNVPGSTSCHPSLNKMASTFSTSIVLVLSHHRPKQETATTSRSLRRVSFQRRVIAPVDYRVNTGVTRIVLLFRRGHPERESPSTLGHDPESPTATRTMKRPGQRGGSLDVGDHRPK